MAAALRPVAGRDKVVRLIMGLGKKGLAAIRAVRPAQINGLPGFVIERGAGEVLTMAFDYRDGVIAGIYLMINPDKLRHLRG
jgi:RNA polymerase sigma-70 factor (ECF subfamily)